MEHVFSKRAHTSKITDALRSAAVGDVIICTASTGERVHILKMGRDQFQRWYPAADATRYEDSYWATVSILAW